MNWETKRNCGPVGGTVSPLVGTVKEQGAKSLKDLQYLA